MDRVRQLDVSPELSDQNLAETIAVVNKVLSAAL
jgi:hypothetical protein